MSIPHYERWNPVEHMNAARAHKPAGGGTTYGPRRVRKSDLTAAMPEGSLERLEFEYLAWRKHWKDLCIIAVHDALFPLSDLDGFGD